ncbi:MAG: putative bifunctional diguanylate cyclase/phosphodiesterase, partial [Algiphilus sp.]
RDELIGCHEADLLAHGVHQALDKPLSPGWSDSSDTMHAERSYRRSDGYTVILQLHVTAVRNFNGDVLNYVAIAHDVTESRRMARELTYRARHDLLTGLLNRYEFERIVKDLAEDTEAERVPAMLLYLDLDQFKIVNDTCGHMAGDAMLTELAALIRGCLRSGDTLARLGGDEFGVLLQHCPPTKAEAIAEKIRSEIAAFRFHWGERSFNLGISIGIVPFMPGEYEGARLLSVADYACYAAKEAGRNQLHLARPEDAGTVRHHEEMNWLSRLQDAHDEDRFFLVWQPIVPMHHASGTPPRHFEVLLRLRERDGSVAMPGSFLSAAERYGKVIELDTWVVTTLMQWLNDNVDCADRIDQLNVNVSGAAVSDPRYIECVTALITASRFPADRLCFEITETMAISNINAATAFMKTLSQYGCRFALDDFGIGSSSFAYLNALPVDFVKIDGAFVHDLDRDTVHESITRCIIEVAHSMGKGTVAEFVETDAVRRRLQMLGCGYAQGFGIGAATALGDFSLRPVRPMRPVLVDTPQKVAV